MIQSRLLLVFIFICITNILMAQEVKGTVSSNFYPLKGAFIRNLTQKTLSVADAEGNFKIDVIDGDTLATSYIGYKTDTLIYYHQSFLLVPLHAFVGSLKEVVIKGNHLSTLQQYKKNQEIYRQIYRIGDNSNMFFSNGSTIGNVGIGVNIDAIFSNFSKQGKDARKLQKKLTRDYHDSVVDSCFTTDLVSSITGYQGKKLDDFMMDNKPTYEFVQSATNYDIIAYIKRRVKGVILKSDYPEPTKPKGKGLKMEFKMPDNQINNSFGNNDNAIQSHP